MKKKVEENILKQQNASHINGNHIKENVSLSLSSYAFTLSEATMAWNEDI